MLEQEIKSLKASEVKGFFDLTVRMLIYSTGIFFQTSSDKRVKRNYQTVQGLLLAILLLVLFAPSKYAPFPTSLPRGGRSHAPTEQQAPKGTSGTVRVSFRNYMETKSPKEV